MKLHLVLVSRNKSDDFSSAGTDGSVGGGEGVSLRYESERREGQSSENERRRRRTHLVDSIDSESKSVLSVLSDLLVDVLFLELKERTKKKERESGEFGRRVFFSTTQRERKNDQTHVEALIGTVLLAQIEVLLTGGGDDSVSHSMSELDGAQT